MTWWKKLMKLESFLWKNQVLTAESLRLSQSRHKTSQTPKDEKNQSHVDATIEFFDFTIEKF